MATPSIAPPVTDHLTPWTTALQARLDGDLDPYEPLLRAGLHLVPHSTTWTPRHPDHSAGEWGWGQDHPPLTPAEVRALWHRGITRWGVILTGTPYAILDIDNKPGQLGGDHYLPHLTTHYGLPLPSPWVASSRSTGGQHHLCLSGDHSYTQSASAIAPGIDLLASHCLLRLYWLHNPTAHPVHLDPTQPLRELPPGLPTHRLSEAILEAIQALTDPELTIGDAQRWAALLATLPDAVPEQLEPILTAALHHTPLTEADTTDIITTALTPPPTTHTTTTQNTSDHLIDLLETGLTTADVQWRNNTRARRPEYHLTETTPPPLRHLAPPHTWQPATDATREAIAEHLQATYTWRPARRSKAIPLHRTDIDRALTLLTAHQTRQIDPFHEWLEALPPLTETAYQEAIQSTPETPTGHWDWVNACLTCHGETNSALATWVSLYIPAVAVLRAHTPGAKADILPILCGPEGIGKSTIIRQLLPPEWQSEWYTDNLQFGTQDDQKRLPEQLLGRVICEIPELAGLRKTGLARLKAWLSRQDDTVRLAYRRDPETLPRLISLVGTTNEAQPLHHDPDGYRRYVVIDVTPAQDDLDTQLASLTTHMATHRQLIWQVALHRHRTHRALIDIPAPLRAAARASAATHQYIDDTALEAIETAQAEAEARGRDYWLLPEGLDKSTRNAAGRLLRAQGRINESRYSALDGKSVRGWWSHTSLTLDE